MQTWVAISRMRQLWLGMIPSRDGWYPSSNWVRGLGQCTPAFSLRSCLENTLSWSTSLSSSLESSFKQLQSPHPATALSWEVDLLLVHQIRICNTGIYRLTTTIGMGVGSLSMIVPMYNAEIAPPEVRGALVGLQQMSITLGILISFWIDYGTVSSIPKLCLRNNDTDRSRILLGVQARDSTMVHGSYP